jgi:hypothetical protein
LVIPTGTFYCWHSLRIGQELSENPGSLASILRLAKGEATRTAGCDTLEEAEHSPSMKPDHEKTGVAAGLAVVVAEVVMAAAGDGLAVVAVIEADAIRSPSRQSHALPVPMCSEGRVSPSLLYCAVSIPVLTEKDTIDGD